MLPSEDGSPQVLDSYSAAKVMKVIEGVGGASPDVWDVAFAELEQEEKSSAGHQGADRKDQEAIKVVRSFGKKSGEGDSGRSSEGG